MPAIPRPATLPSLKKPSLPPAAPAVAATNPASVPPPKPSVPPPGMPKSPSIPAPPPVIQIEEEATLDPELVAIAKSQAELDAGARRSRISTPDGDGPRGRLSSNPDEPQPTSRRSFEDLLPASRRGEQDPDIPPPTHVDAERAPGSKDPYIGTTFDHRYKIEKLLGEGGMGFVYLARHKVIDKKVAVKVLRSDMARDREILERFLQEARAASSIGNPHIIDISDFGDLPDGSTYFVMEFLDGKSLIQLNEDKAKRLEPELIAKIAIQMANGLAAAHERGIIHRDLKPENIFIIQRGIDKEFVKILDFGIAKVATSGDNKLTRAGAVFGTPHYMSPEQAAGAPLDHRTDIYSLGIMLYEMVSNQLPFVADNFMGILSQHMYQPPTPLAKLGLEPPCPPDLEAIIFKCLSKVPEDRYPDMAALAADLQRFQQGHVPEAVAEMASRPDGLSASVPDGVADKPKKSPWIRFIAVGAVVMGATLGTVLILLSGPTQKPDPGAVTSQAATAPPAPTAAAAKKVVLVDVDPRDANASTTYAGKLLTFPANFEVEPGKPVTFEVNAKGYNAQKITIDGSQDKQTVKLVAIAGTTPATTDAGTARPPTTKGGSHVGPLPSTKKGNNAASSGGDIVDIYHGGTSKP
ncbi:serine/threonine-protein kinase [Polyangium sp. 6x1]|uniref:serine/threonine-protein kinase n=1 Tax=Polyangium sp. 6x1 TaxID=3042689 RepID=UPI0024821553|nr:serine/threonine-protein kinase [Polyangium sp. 6x1]MDI1450708.1 serine/threonine-protein kinase [Polyangium sp. 6x1]